MARTYKLIKEMLFVMNNSAHAPAPVAASLVDPYLLQTLQGLVGSIVAVQTARGTVHGKLSHMTPDHVVLDVSNAPFFIRLQQVIWVVPLSSPTKKG